MLATGARVVVSIWGTTVEDYGRAAEMLVDVPDGVIAVEVNVSCPNHHDRGRMFAQSPEQTAAAVAAASVCGRPMWAKLSPSVPSLDPDRRGGRRRRGRGRHAGQHRPRAWPSTPRPAGPGWAAGAAACRARRSTRSPCGPSTRSTATSPTCPSSGVGGVANGVDAVELMLAGASAVQVGTASFADPRSVERVRDEIEEWCRSHGVGSVRELIGDAHV